MNKPIEGKIVQQVAPSLPDKPPTNPLDKIRHPKKLQFIETFYATGGNVTKTCRALKMPRCTYYWWMQKDPHFKAVIDEQFQEILDEANERLINRATKGKHSTAELIFLLKSRHPDYRPVEKIGYEDKNKGIRFIVSRG